MNKTLKWKIIFLLFVVAYSFATLAPTLFKGLPQWWQTFTGSSGLHLGLDLQGGMHLVLRVNLDQAIENSVDLAAQDLKESLNEKKISIVRMSSPDKLKVLFTLPNTSAIETIKKTATDEFPDITVDVQAETGSFPRITVALKDDRISFIRKNAVSQVLEILRNRIDQFGVAEPVIIRQGESEIVVQLPGIDDPKRAMNLLGQTAQLQFKLLADTTTVDLNNLIKQAEESGKWKQGEPARKLNLAIQQQLPAGTELYFESNIDPATKIETKTPILVKSQVLMTGDMVKDAQVRVGGTFNEPYASLDLTNRGGAIFAKVTSENVGKRFAIILDDVVKSAPVIREKILGGSAMISGNFTFESASDLAIVLRVGALPAPVDIIQNLTVGASLGQDSIDKGLMAGYIGTALVVLFMMYYYRLSGVIANGAMVLNVLMLFAGLAALRATLTLPGIAGIILSIGMAVDSNVLIYERMREEFALGKTVKTGVDGGYDKAFWTIVDAHVTTLITSTALFLFGTGSIKGFAVTLTLGVTINLFCTLFGTRIVYDVMHVKQMLKPLKFLHFIEKTKIDFMQIKTYTYGISIVMSLIGLIAFAQILRGQANLGIDFTGGILLQYKSDKAFNLDEVRKAVHIPELEGIELQEVKNENRLILRLKKSAETLSKTTELIANTLNEKLTGQEFSLESQSEIGAAVSETLRNKAFFAILISLIGVLVYLALRFDVRFGVAAAIATFHDILFLLGICYLLRIEINLLIITALLTIGGYSLNDTVVVFDRIRENLHKHHATDTFYNIINISINEVLSRTLVTSITVFLSVIALYLFGGSVIHEFSLALVLGVLIGTYSSIFIASPLLHLWRHMGKTDLQAE